LVCRVPACQAGWLKISEALQGHSPTSIPEGRPMKDNVEDHIEQDSASWKKKEEISFALRPILMIT
jgi:hypothetical protein